MGSRWKTAAAATMFLQLMLMLPVATVEGAGHFSTREVDVVISREEDHVALTAGNLTMRLSPDTALVRSMMVPGVREEVMSQLGATVYSGRVGGRSKCKAVIMISDDEERVEGNIDCEKHHMVLETVKQGHNMPKYILQGRRQKKGKRDQNQLPPSPKAENRFCTLFIHTDPMFWRHVQASEMTESSTTSRIFQLMIGHLIAANKLYQKVTFSGNKMSHQGIQFVLAGYQIDDDSSCEEQENTDENVDISEYVDEVDYTLYSDNDYDTGIDLFGGNGNETIDYSSSEYNYSDLINDQDYGDWDDDVDFDQVLETIRNPFNKTKDDALTLYDEDYYEDWDYEEAAGHPDYDDLITPNDQDCYENINGTINPAEEFCKKFQFHDSGKFLNLFSTIDHSNYCLAHIWTYRDFDVVGLADNPTEGSPGLSGYCAWYDPDCSMGFNTGLVTFRHLGNRLSLADSQETFMHELGHSIGAGHDPREVGRCSPGGVRGNYIMHPGPIGNSHIRREFSQCSKKEIGKVLEETEHSCLITLEEVEKSTEEEGVEQDIEMDEDHVMELTCSDEELIGFLEKITIYTKDLRDYFETKDQRKKFFRLNKKTKNIIGEIKGSSINNDVKKEKVKKLAKKLLESVNELNDELTIFLGRKITKLCTAISNCVKLV